MSKKPQHRREQMANACWQQWFDLGYVEQGANWEAFQEMEVFWKEYDALLGEAKTAAGEFKVVRFASQSPGKPEKVKKNNNPGKKAASQTPQKQSVGLSFKGNFSHTLQIPQQVQKQAIGEFWKGFVPKHLWAFMLLFLPYVGITHALAIDWMSWSSFLLYMGSWAAIAGMKSVVKKKEIKARYQVETNQITKKTSFGKNTIVYKAIEEVEVSATQLVVKIKKNNNPDNALLMPGMYITTDIEHYKELKQHLQGIARNNALAKKKLARKANKKKISKQQQTRQQNHYKGMQKHHQRMHSRRP